MARKKTPQLVRIPGTARRYVDKKTGKEYSRYAATKILKEQGKIKPVSRITKSGAPRRSNKVYLSLRNAYIAKLQQKGKFISVRAAMQSDELKLIQKMLKDGAKLKKQGKIVEGNKMIIKALKKTTRRDGIPDFINPGESPKV